MKNTFLIFTFLIFSVAVFAQKTIIKTDKAPTPTSPYSQAVEANGLIFVAGQIGLDPATRQLVTGGIEAETTQVMENIKAILQAAGLSMNDIVNTTLYLKDMGHFQKVNEIYGKYFSGNYPARATLGASALPAGSLIEVAVVAARPPRRK